MNPPVLMAFTGLGISVVTWGYYLSRIPLNKVPERPVAATTLQSLATLLSIGALVFGATRGSVGPMLVLPAAGGVALGAFFLWLLTQRKTPIGDLRVAVGQPLLEFDCQSSDGQLFRTSELGGQRVLLKFFRGGW